MQNLGLVFTAILLLKQELTRTEFAYCTFVVKMLVKLICIHMFNLVLIFHLIP